MTEKEIELFEKVNAQIESVYEEISNLSKKSPNDALNKFKLKFVNQILLEVNTILDEKYKPFKDFENFTEDDLPTNADVVFMLSQYLSCMEKLRADNIGMNLGNWYWLADEESTAIRTAPPKKIKER